MYIYIYMYRPPTNSTNLYLPTYMVLFGWCLQDAFFKKQNYSLETDISFPLNGYDLGWCYKLNIFTIWEKLGVAGSKNLTKTLIMLTCFFYLRCSDWLILSVNVHPGFGNLLRKSFEILQSILYMRAAKIAACLVNKALSKGCCNNFTYKGLYFLFLQNRLSIQD